MAAILQVSVICAQLNNAAKITYKCRKPLFYLLKLVLCWKCGKKFNGFICWVCKEKGNIATCLP